MLLVISSVLVVSKFRPMSIFLDKFGQFILGLSAPLNPKSRHGIGSYSLLQFQHGYIIFVFLSLRQAATQLLWNVLFGCL
jgi:hypothetical protein